MPKGVRWGDLANGENLYVTKNSKYPEVAWDFVKFLESDRWLQELLKVSGWLPQRRDADLKEILAGQPAYKAFLFSDPGTSSTSTRRRCPSTTRSRPRWPLV